MRCPACNASVSDDAEVCGTCGRKLQEDDAKRTMMGIPAMGGDEPGQDEDADEGAARSTLFGIPAASREESNDSPAPTGPGGAPVQDDSTPVPSNYQGEGDARTQVADEDMLSDALRDSGAHDSARSTMFGLPKASKDEGGDDDEDIASQWGLGEESDDAENKTMVASGNILEQAVDSGVSGEGTGYSKPQADVDPNVSTLMGMLAEEDEESDGEEELYDDDYEDEYDDVGDSTQALSAEELERFEQQIKAEDGYRDPSEAPDKPEPSLDTEPAPAPSTQTSAPEQEAPAEGDSKRRRSLLKKLKRRSEEEGEADDPRRTAAGIPAAQKGKKDKPNVGKDTIDERGAGSGTRFSIPKPGGGKASAADATPESQSENQSENKPDASDDGRNRAETPRSGVLQARKLKKTSDSGKDRQDKDLLESSSSYRINGSSDAKLEEPESSAPAEQASADPQSSNTSFPISDAQSQQSPQQGGSPQAPASDDRTAVLDDDQIQNLSLDDTAALSDEELDVEPVDEIEEVDEIALAETGVSDPDELPGNFDETRSAAPEQFGSATSTSGVVQPGQGGSGVTQPPGGSGVSEPGSSSGVTQPGGGSGVSQPARNSGVIQPGESSGVVQPGQASGLQDASDGGSGVIQPDTGQAGGSGVEPPSDSGVEPPASSTQRGGFGTENAGSGVAQAPDESQPSPTPQQQRTNSEANFGATPVGTSTAGASDEAPQQHGGFGASGVPNPSQGAGAESSGDQQTQSSGQQTDDASSLERKIRVVFAVIGALVTMGAGGAAFTQGVMEMPAVEKGIFLSPLAIGLLTLGVGVLPLSSGLKSIGLVLMTLLAGAALAAAIVFEAAPVIMLLLVGGTLLTLCSAAFPALVKLVK